MTSFKENFIHRSNSYLAETISAYFEKNLPGCLRTVNTKRCTDNN
jgi:hypothetical protein